MKLSARYGTHLLALMRAVYKTRGDVLELGIGPFSTPILHEMCVSRCLVSIDNSMEFYEWAKKYQTEFHEIEFVNNWDEADIEKQWDVVLVDHSPSERRVTEIKKLSRLARYIVAHDANGRYDDFYHYSTIYPLFKYKYVFSAVEPSTVILSNFVDLGSFWSRREQR